MPLEDNVSTYVRLLILPPEIALNIISNKSDTQENITLKLDKMLVEKVKVKPYIAISEYTPLKIKSKLTDLLV